MRPDDITPGADGVNMGKICTAYKKVLANFEQLKATISVCDIPFVMVHPMKWQNELKLRVKMQRKKEEKSERKNRYKEIAGNLYPELKPTLWNADATLIMHFGRYILRNNRIGCVKIYPVKCMNAFFSPVERFYLFRR